MLGSGEFLRTTVSMGVGVLLGALAIAQVLATRNTETRAVAARQAPNGVVVGPNGRLDPIVTGAVSLPGGGQTIILDPCTGLRKD